MSNNDPFSRPWRLEMSVLIVSLGGDHPTENVIDILHCFAPQPLRITASTDIGGEKCLLAANGDIIDPILGGAST